jgi:hypothetical protein
MDCISRAGATPEEYPGPRFPQPRENSTLNAPSLEPLRDFDCCCEICHPPKEPCMFGEVTVAPYPKGTVQVSAL